MSRRCLSHFAVLLLPLNVCHTLARPTRKLLFHRCSVSAVPRKLLKCSDIVCAALKTLPITTNLLRAPMSPASPSLCCTLDVVPQGIKGWQRGRFDPEQCEVQWGWDVSKIWSSHSIGPPLFLPLQGRHFTCQVSLSLKGDPVPTYYLHSCTEARARGFPLKEGLLLHVEVPKRMFYFQKILFSYFFYFVFKFICV